MTACSKPDSPTGNNDDTDPPTPLNNPPEVQSVQWRPDSVLTGDTLRVFAVASDKDSDSLSIDWVLDGGTIISNSSDNPVLCIAPDSPGNMKIGCRVSDGVDTVQYGVAIPVYKKPENPRVDSLQYFPHSLGNLWLYRTSFDESDYTYSDTVHLRLYEVVDRLSENDGLLHYKINRTGIDTINNRRYDYSYWVQIDSLEGKYYRRSISSRTRYGLDFTAPIGDEVTYGNGSSAITIAAKGYVMSSFDGKDYNGKKYRGDQYFYNRNWTFLYGLGPVYQTNTINEYFRIRQYLLGAKINDSILGDTTLLKHFD